MNSLDNASNQNLLFSFWHVYIVVIKDITEHYIYCFYMAIKSAFEKPFSRLRCFKVPLDDKICFQSKKI